MDEAIDVQRQKHKRLEDQQDLQVTSSKLKAYSEADSREAPRAEHNVRSHGPPVSNENKEIRHK